MWCLSPRTRRQWHQRRQRRLLVPPPPTLVVLRAEEDDDDDEVENAPHAGSDVGQVVDTARCKTCVAAARMVTAAPAVSISEMAVKPTTTKTKINNKKRLLCSECHVVKSRQRFHVNERVVVVVGTDDNSPPPPRKCRVCWKHHLLKPRECSGCRQSKSLEQYSLKQWEDYTNTERKCLDCYPAATEDWDNVKSEVLRRRKQGCQSYTCPDPLYDHPKKANRLFFSSSSTTNDDSAPLVLLPEDLVGTYDIFFQYGPVRPTACIERRTTQGTLTIEMLKKQEEEDQKEEESHSTILVGSITRLLQVKMNKVWEDDYTFRQTDRTLSPSNNAVVEFVISPISDEEAAEEEAAERVEIRRVVTKLPLLWRSRDGYCTKHQKVPEDTTLDQAEELMRRYHQVLSAQNSWMVHHLPILANPYIAQRIHSYVAWHPPPPVVFLEPGDLCISTYWGQLLFGLDQQNKVPTHLFARRHRHHCPDTDTSREESSSSPSPPK